MISKKPQEELWITNINRFKDITLGDLALKVPRGVSINLLAKKKNGLSKFNLTRKQIDDSIKSGSIFKKGNYIKVRQEAPVPVFVPRVEVAPVLDKASTRTVRKPPDIEKVDFPDLDMDEGTDKSAAEEAFAAEIAEMDAFDRAPVLAVDPIFKYQTDDE